MKKFTALFLAFLLLFSLSTTALAAAPEAATGAQTAVTDNSGETVVTVAVNAGNLSVTVPVSMTIVAPVAGGECTEPTNYAIVNKSALAVKVVGIQVIDPEGGLTFSNTAPTTAVADNDKVSIALTPAGQEDALQLTTANIDTGLGGFDMAAATDADGVSKAIAITAVSGMLTGTANYSDAFTIKFTVAAGTTGA